MPPSSRYPLNLVASLSGDDLATLLEQAKWERPDIIELRLDQWGPFLKVDFLEKLTRFRQKIAIPLMLSFRGGKPLPSWWQNGWWTQLKMIDWLDVEWNASYPWKTLWASLRQTRAKIIMSHHEFESTPPSGKLDKLLQAMSKLKPDVLKLATFAKSEDDVKTLLSLSQKWAAKGNVAVMAMGPHATASRFSAPLYGSCLAYGFVGKPTAKGQLPFGHLRDQMRVLYPRYNQAFQSRFTGETVR